MLLKENQEMVQIVKGNLYSYYVSVVKWSDTEYEIAVMEYNEFYKTWEIDYQIFEDVLKATSSMEVYGIVEYLIKPAYL